MISQIEKKYQEMSAGQKSIADFIKNHISEAVYMNAKEISERSGVSESAVVRFSTFLGYNGFKDMQKSMQDEVKVKQTIAERFIEALTVEEENLNDIMRVYNRTIKNLNDTLGDIPESMYDSAVKQIMAARRIGVVGTRLAVAPALMLQILLNELVPEVQLFTPNFDTSFDMLQTWGDKDLLIGFSFMRAKNFSYDMLLFGKEKGCRIISICDNYRNSIAGLGDIVLPVRSEAEFVSFVPTMHVIDTLLFKISRQLGRSNVEKLKNLDEIIRRFVNHK